MGAEGGVRPAFPGLSPEKEGFAGSLLKGEMGANPRWRGGALGLIPPISCFEFSQLEAFPEGPGVTSARD